MSGIITNIPSSSTDSKHKFNVKENLSATGNWTLLVKNGTAEQFNSTLGEYFEGPSAGVLNIGGFSSTAHKHIQLGTFGSHMINGILDL